MRVSIVRLTASCLFAVSGLVGIGCDCAATPVTECSTSADCAEGETCIDRRCVARSDAGRSDGGGLEDAPGAACVDVDRDGHFAIDPGCPAGDDCDDLNPAVHGGQPELCADGIDNDCNEGTDEPSCGCDVGQTVTCYTGAVGTSGVGLCRPGVAVCTDVGTPGECRGEQGPSAEDAPEDCNFEDDDCDGQVDEGLRNACGACSTDPLVELCGDDVDNDCNGMTDESCDCDYRCMCEPMTSCECTPPTNQPCYEGPFGTDGNGVCRGGVRDCVLVGDAAMWQACEGQVLPGTECGGGTADGADDDCDGLVDEGCRDGDMDGSAWPLDCDDADPAVRPGAAETCNDRDDNCNGVADEGVTNRCGRCGAVPSEVCDDGRDDDCDGVPDDGCTCEGGTMRDCYLGPAGTDGIGRCRPGRQTCEGASEFAMWGACDGVGPIPEICNGEDDDCDGMADERWSAGSNACGFCDPTEVCDGEDNDCDGFVDEHVSNSCGECGPEPIETCDGDDDDCDGTIDEGTTNACGTCPPEPCFIETWDRPADCMDPGRTCDGVVEDMDHPGAITLGEGTLTFDYIYIAVTNMGMVAQLDTTTGAVNWIRSSYGQNPSRTSVAFDGSVWVGNRGFSDPSNVAISNLVHLDTDGTLICRAAGATGLIRGVAIDAEGNVWAGAFNGRRVYRVSGTDVDRTTTPPTCRLLAMYDVPVNVYGLAVDPDGYVWTGSTPAIRIRIADGTQTSVSHSGYYGLAPDGAGRMWYGSWSSGLRLHAIDRTTLAETATTIANPLTGVTVHPDGSVWGTAYGANRIEAWDPVLGRARCGTAIPSFAGDSNPHGIAVDRTGRIWAPNRYGGYVNVYDSTSCAHIARYPVSPGQELYSYSDMTGHLLRTFTAPEGHWYQVFDSGYANAYWNEVSWVADVPADSSVEVVVRASDSPTDFSGSVACGPFTTTPADISGCAIGRHRYLQIDMVLRSMRSGIRPVVYRVDARWAY